MFGVFIKAPASMIELKSLQLAKDRRVSVGLGLGPTIAIFAKNGLDCRILLKGAMVGSRMKMHACG